ncbi:MAG: helix-turn-helix transcriptional regulator [Prevotella sp.]|nr:helix-turn-helix transcriptional regulator [Prevotella sp.]
MSLEEIQFGGMLTMALLTLTLAFLLPVRTAMGNIFSRARWLMAGATSLLFIQFLLQYTLHFRQMGITQGVFINLLFFVPCAWQLSLGVLYLQRNGKVLRHEWLGGIGAYVIMVMVLIIGGKMKGHSLLDDTPEMRAAEYVAACIYSIIQLYYSWLNAHGFRRLRRALDNYYDHDKGDMLRWMERSVLLLSLSALFVPPTLFATGPLLLAYSVFIFLSMYYCIFSFICYGVSSAPQQVMDAELGEEEEEKEEEEKDEEEKEIVKAEKAPNTDELERTAEIVSRWIAANRHLNSGITIQTAANEMHISRHQLTVWLKTTEQELFNPWLTHLRIEEAKRMLKDHHEWSNDHIAESCGFSSRSYFHNVFRKQTGLTPSQYAEQKSAESPSDAESTTTQ